MNFGDKEVGEDNDEANFGGMNAISKRFIKRPIRVQRL